MAARNLAFWTLVAATGGVYATMLAWSIPMISAEAGGLPVLDMRPGGYTFEAARTFLAALSESGRDFYLHVQLRLDIAYPALLAATLVWAIVRLAPARWGVMRFWLAVAALPGMAFDYAENFMIMRMLKAGADGLTPEMAATASFFSRAKAITTSIAFTLLLGLLVYWLFRLWRSAAKRA